jgi:hypothetical protein
MERSRLGSFAKRGLWDADVNSERISIERLLDYFSSLFFIFLPSQPNLPSLLEMP